MSELKAGIYRHYKGGLYLMLGLARHSETDEKFVAYVPLGVQRGPRITVRPYEMFFDSVQIDGKTRPRFEYADESISSDLAQQYDHLSGYKGTNRIDD